jgi:hypothetical protein
MSNSYDYREVRLFIYSLIILAVVAIAFGFGVTIDFAGVYFSTGPTDSSEVIRDENPKEQIGNPTQSLRGRSEPSSNTVPNAQ